jgi:hypothetical protein
VRSVVKIMIMFAAVSAASTAAAAPAAHHRVKHHGRHLRARHVTPGAPLLLAPHEHPGYRYGGPLYSTCDRINADPMLVGTCR